MSDKYTQLIQEARESGEIPDSWLERIETTYEASGLRTDLKATREAYQKTLDENRTLRSGLLADRFKSIGITISPTVLNIPDTLDPTDTDKVSEWAQEMGLIPKQETTPPAERATHDRIAAASNEGNATVIPSVSDIQNLPEEEFWKQAAAREAAIKAGKITP